MSTKFRNLLAVFIGIIPLNTAMIWYRLTASKEFGLSDMLLYPLLFGGGSILLILALNRYLLNGKPADFNTGKGTWYLDISAGVVLTLLYFLLVFAGRLTILPLLPRGNPPSAEVINLMISLSEDPLLLAIWLGPVVWIGVAAFEEIQRTFFMNCLWKLSGNKIWQIFVIVLVASLWGLMHLYQGSFGIISVSVQGLLMGAFYFRFRRIWPLIISHALYDSIQIVMFVVQR